MVLFKNECLRDTAFPSHDLMFKAPLFGPRYGRHHPGHRAFGLSSAALHGDDEFFETASIESSDRPSVQARAA